MALNNVLTDQRAVAGQQNDNSRFACCRARKPFHPQKLFDFVQQNFVLQEQEMYEDMGVDDDGVQASFYALMVMSPDDAVNLLVQGESECSHWIHTALCSDRGRCHHMCKVALQHVHGLQEAQTRTVGQIVKPLDFQKQSTFRTATYGKVPSPEAVADSPNINFRSGCCTSQLNFYHACPTPGFWLQGAAWLTFAHHITAAMQALVHCSFPSLHQQAAA